MGELSDETNSESIDLEAKSPKKQLNLLER